MNKALVFFAALLLALESFAVGASQEWVKDYVQKSTVSTNLIDALNQILASKYDDEIKTDAEGRLYYTVLEKVNGSYTNTVHYLTPSSSEERLGTFYGAIVTESVNGFFKTGDTLAFAADQAEFIAPLHHRARNEPSAGTRNGNQGRRKCRHAKPIAKLGEKKICLI